MYIVNFCSECGSKIEQDAKFCPECGALRYGTRMKIEPDQTKTPVFPIAPAKTVPVFGMEAPPKKEERKDRLKLLVDCCRKVLATACGDGHNETVLYLNEDTGNYEIHTYDQEGGHYEIHHAYLTDKNTYDQIMQKIKESGIEEYENKQGLPLCGGDYVCKYLSGDRIIGFPQYVLEIGIGYDRQYVFRFNFCG